MFFTLPEDGNPLDKKKVESIVQMAKQDPADFEPLYLEYYGQLMSFVTAKTGDQHLAEELVSNCFYKALSKLHTYKPSEKGFTAWLYTIALNEVRMHFRKSKQASFAFDIENFKEIISSDSSDNEELKEEIQQKLSYIPDKDLQLLELRFTENLSFQNIGEILNTSSDNAKTKTYRLLKKIRNLFTQQPVEL